MFEEMTSGISWLWAPLVWCLTQMARVVVPVSNILLFPQARTQKPNLAAILVWAAINIAVFWATTSLVSAELLLVTGGVLALLHFLTIVSSLLVITEENDVWAGYIKFNRVSGKGDRIFPRGAVMKSLPLMMCSAIFYLMFIGAALKGYEAQRPIFETPLNSDAPMQNYIITVAAQVPTLAELIDWVGFRALVMRFAGIEGLLIKCAIEISVVSIIIGTLNSYFRQRGEIKRLVDALGAGKGDVHVLEGLASRAPDEIKRSILTMALHDPAARTRRRAMTVALYANILTFPTTFIHNLKTERNQRNRLHGIEVAAGILKMNSTKYEVDYLQVLDQKIAFQLRNWGARPKSKTLEALIKLRELIKPWLN